MQEENKQFDKLYHDFFQANKNHRFSYKDR
jgi:hypothetical protein